MVRGPHAILPDSALCRPSSMNFPSEKYLIDHPQNPEHTNLYREHALFFLLFCKINQGRLDAKISLDRLSAQIFTNPRLVETTRW